MHDSYKTQPDFKNTFDNVYIQLPHMVREFRIKIIAYGILQNMYHCLQYILCNIRKYIIPLWV